MKIKFWFVLIVSIAFSPNLSAYSVGNHKKISNIAINLYNKCAVQPASPRWSKPLNEAEAFRLVDGSYSEDEDFFDKGTSWHFYDREGKIGRESILKVFSILVAEPSMHVRFNELETTAVDLVKIESLRSWHLYDPVGKMAHYLQDVSVPAHVIPIFHPFKSKISDAFDNFKINADKVNESVNSNVCEFIKELSNKSFNQILDNYADKTFEMINSDIKGLVDKKGNPVKATTFWSLKLNERMFGDYGVAGNRFGKKKVCIKSEVDEDFILCTERLKIKKTIYKNIALQQHIKAVKATIEAIALIQMMKNN